MVVDKSMKQGTFIISLDCEGKWGVAEKVYDHHRRTLTNENLELAYRKILKLFSEYDTTATFAFVLAFTMETNDWLRFKDRFRDLQMFGSNRLRYFREAEARKDFDGWFCPQALDLTLESGGHEIACHGFSHLQMQETNLDRESAEHEIATACEIAEHKGIELETFVYPRNLVGHTDVLRKAGFAGYRERKVTMQGQFGRLQSLLSEWNIAQSAQTRLPSHHGMVRIPPGEFFNWRYGMRKAVPASLTVHRWRSILNSAATQGRVAHLWLHPRNLIDGPGTFGVLKQVISLASKLRDSGKLSIQTQAAYTRQNVDS